MSKVSIKTQADDIVVSFAGTKEHDKVRAVRTFCNSDSALVAWAKKTAFSTSAIRNARLIQQTWRRFGAARSRLITIRAVKAVIVKMLVSADLASLRVADAINFLQSVSKKSTAPAVGVVGDALAQPQQALFA